MNLSASLPQAVLWADRVHITFLAETWCRTCDGRCYSLSVKCAVIEEHGTAERNEGPYRHLALSEALSYAMLITGAIADGVDLILKREMLAEAGQQALPFEPS